MKKNILLIVLVFQNFLNYSQDIKFIALPGSKIHYQTFGKGNPILILNGGPGMSSEGFVTLAKELSINNQTIIYDQRGTGLSTLDEIDGSTVTMDLMAEDIETLRKHLKIEKWIVMGHSFGGMLAYYYASKYPNRVKGMIQSSSGGMDLKLLSSINITDRLPQKERDSLSFYNQKISQGDTTYQTRLKRGQFLAPAYLYNKKYAPIVAERLTQGNSQINNLVWANLQAISFDVKETMKTFKKPVLILQGADDIVNMAIAKTAHKILPNSKLIVLEECSHYGWLEQKEKYYSEIENFVQAIA